MKYSRQELIEKIAAHCKITLQPEPETNSEHINQHAPDRRRVLIKTAMVLPRLIEINKKKDELIERLAKEAKEANDELSEIKSAIEKEAREKAIDGVVAEMIDKQLISIYEQDEKKAELSSMDKSSFEKFSSVISKIAASDIQKYGADSLQYLIPNGNIKEEKGPVTFAESFLEDNDLL